MTPNTRGGHKIAPLTSMSPLRNPNLHSPYTIPPDSVGGHYMDNPMPTAYLPDWNHGTSVLSPGNANNVFELSVVTPSGPIDPTLVGLGTGDYGAGGSSRMGVPTMPELESNHSFYTGGTVGQLPMAWGNVDRNYHSADSMLALGHPQSQVRALNPGYPPVGQVILLS